MEYFLPKSPLISACQWERGHSCQRFLSATRREVLAAPGLLRALAGGSEIAADWKSDWKSAVFGAESECTQVEATGNRRQSFSCKARSVMGGCERRRTL